MRIVEEAPYRFRIEREGPMRVPGVVFTARESLPDPATDKSLQQVANVATLPGIVEASYAMPDVHWGYGFPIGGVAATDIDSGGVVSPGGVGFDISCGVRLLASTGIGRHELAPKLGAIMDRLDRAIPRGVARGGLWRLRNRSELDMLAAATDGGRTAIRRPRWQSLDAGSYPRPRANPPLSSDRLRTFRPGQGRPTRPSADRRASGASQSATERVIHVKWSTCAWPPITEHVTRGRRATVSQTLPGLDESGLVGDDDSLGSVTTVQLLQDAGDMRHRRVLAHHERGGDLLVGQPARD